MISIIIALIVFAILIVVHELGHFIAARLCGVKVNEFAIGMGPKLFSRQRGETVYSLRVFPIGGFCSMLGEDENSDDERALNNKSVKARLFIMVAGAFMNFVLAFVMIFLVTLFQGYNEPVISSFVEEYNAEASGLQEGDKILSVNGSKISIHDDLTLVLYTSYGKPLDVEVERMENGESKIVNVKVTPIFNPERQTYFLGIRTTPVNPIFGEGIDEEIVKDPSFFGTVGYSFNKIGFYVRYVYFGLARMVTNQFQPEDAKDPNLPKEEVAGPVRIVQFMGDTFEAGASSEGGIFSGILNVLQLATMISVNLGVVNLLPLPALDGGRVLFLLIEGIRRKPINPEKEGIVHFAGFVLLIILMIFVLYNDIANIISGV